MSANHLFPIPEGMQRVEKIRKHPKFQQAIEAVGELEKERIFCCHGMDHLLDVARLAYIENLEQELGYRKDQVYAAGLLHDVGKYLQYRDGIEHHIASEQLAREILQDCGYRDEEIDEISSAILGHRDVKRSEENKLGKILYKADKISRCCYMCKAAEECNWNKEKRTAGVIS